MAAITYCGLSCEACPFRAKGSCPGCQQSGGKVFWGTCDLAVCCIGRKLDHCGQCGQFPCEQLKAYSFHPQHGDNGRRIENLRRAIGEGREQ